MGVVAPYLMGGLGNWLFQAAFARLLGGDKAVLCTQQCSRSPHSTIDYFNTILARYPRTDARDIKFNIVKEHEYMWGFNIPKLIESAQHNNILLYGYFQKHEYIPENFGDLLDYKNPPILLKYPDIGETCFIHIRGGDYVGSPVHDVGLSSRYYSSCIEFMKKRGITRFTVFTNDRNFCSKQKYLDDIRYTIIDENELDTLYLMTECKAAIISNSTFSWWGAYLNRNRLICVPSKWFNNPIVQIQGYFFPGCFVHQV
jgi:hypothetical protein